MLLVAILPDDLEFKKYYSKTRRELFFVSQVYKKWFLQTQLYGHLIKNFDYDPELLKLEIGSMTKYCFPSDRYVISFEKPTTNEIEEFRQTMDLLTIKYPEYQSDIQKINRYLHC
jgi:hypothetical protein